MEFGQFVRALEQRLMQPLPGRQAQLKMASLSRLQALIRFTPPGDAIQSSVLILLYPVHGITRLVLMLRPEYPGIHGGQISLPGGKYEETDDTLIFTALREAGEEIGIDPVRVQILGQLTELYIPPSNYLVTPVVGYQASPPLFKADPKEVAKIIEINLYDLLDENNIWMKKLKTRLGISMKFPAFCIDGNTIWGATAMILSEFIEICREIPVKNTEEKSTD